MGATQANRGGANRALPYHAMTQQINQIEMIKYIIVNLTKKRVSTKVVRCWASGNLSLPFFWILLSCSRMDSSFACAIR